ncbi:MAG: 3',5'-cyclic adenosine monophosphate phosphodiesterase CpdA [Minwuia thermotolerans]|nr:MAG: 3',5'-cyclic adenosine monophosphate phosphodiesterase CpdA [Minwuia thermotolerans]
MILIQISDLHITDPGEPVDRLARTTERLAIAVARINAMQPRPDGVIVTGDLVNECRTSEYERLRQTLVPLQVPVWLMVGNHDARDDLRLVFDDHAYLGTRGFVQYTVEDLTVRLIALDSQIPGETAGALCAERLGWLEDRLAEQPDRPTMIFVHHPPFPSGIDRMDANGLVEGREELARIIGSHRQILGIGAGHVHRPIMTAIAGVPAHTCPSTAHQLGLDLLRTDGVSIVAEPPACLMHTRQPGAPLVTHHVYLDDYPVLADVSMK